jgi:hypothetical protein
MTFSLVCRFGAAIVLASALTVPAIAQTAPAAKAQTAPAAKPPTPEHLALARAVLDFTGAGKSFDAVVPKLLEDVRNVILRTRPTLQVDLDATIADLRPKLGNADEELINAIAKVYATKFTEAELKEIAAFYQSSAGQKLSSSMPEVLRESYGLAQDWSRKMSVDVMTRVREEMKKKGHEI